MIFNILVNTTELWMTKNIIGEIFSSGGATLYKKLSDQTVVKAYEQSLFIPPFAHSAFWQGCQLSQPFCSRALKQIADIFCFFLSQPLLIILDPALPSPSFFRSFFIGTNRILYSLVFRYGPAHLLPITHLESLKMDYQKYKYIHN